MKNKYIVQHKSYEDGSVSPPEGGGGDITVSASDLSRNIDNVYAIENTNSPSPLLLPIFERSITVLHFCLHKYFRFHVILVHYFFFNHDHGVL